jgi:hypothetical protein
MNHNSVTDEISKTQIDRLGDRLRTGEITEADLRLLDEYRRSFREAYDFVVIAIRDELPRCSRRIILHRKNKKHYLLLGREPKRCNVKSD